MAFYSLRNLRLVLEETFLYWIIAFLTLDHKEEAYKTVIFRKYFGVSRMNFISSDSFFAWFTSSIDTIIPNFAKALHLVVPFVPAETSQKLSKKKSFIWDKRNNTDSVSYSVICTFSDEKRLQIRRCFEKDIKIGSR